MTFGLPHITFCTFIGNTSLHSTWWCGMTYGHILNIMMILVHITTRQWWHRLHDQVALPSCPLCYFIFKIHERSNMHSIFIKYSLCSSSLPSKGFWIISGNPLRHHASWSKAYFIFHDGSYMLFFFESSSLCLLLAIFFHNYLFMLGRYFYQFNSSMTNKNKF